MITAIVNYSVPESFTREQVFGAMKMVAPRFEHVPGLIRKNFIFDDARRIGGGVYTWETREAAEKLYAEDGPWRKAVRDMYGNDPEVSFFETPAIVDNVLGEIRSA